MTKLSRTFRFDKKTIDRIEFLKTHLSTKLGVPFNNTTVLEYLVNHYFNELNKE